MTASVIQEIKLRFPEKFLELFKLHLAASLPIEQLSLSAFQQIEQELIKEDSQIRKADNKENFPARTDCNTSHVLNLAPAKRKFKELASRFVGKSSSQGMSS